MQIVLPAPVTSKSGKRSPNYLTANVASMKIIVSQGSTVGPTTVVGLRPGDPGCSGGTGGTKLTCSAKLQVPIGNDTFELTSYDASGATGNAISHAIVPKQIVAGTNSLPVAMNGIVTSISILTGAEGVYEGANKTTPIVATIVAQDADNNTVVGTFDTPVKITADGTLIQIVGGSTTLNSSSDTIAFTYSIPDPLPPQYNGKATFCAQTCGSSSPIYVAEPPIDNPITINTESNTQPNPHPGGIALWYDAADSAMLTVAGGHVTSWHDRSGSMNTVSQSTVALQPVVALNRSTHSNKQALSFTAGQYLTGTGFPPGEYTVLIAAMNSGSPGTLVGGAGARGTSTLAHVLTVPTSSEIDLVQGGVLGPKLTGPDVTSPYYAIAKVAAGSGGTGTATLSYHGTVSASPNSATVTMATTNDPNFVINAADATGSGAAANTIGEIIVLDHAITTYEQILYEVYLHRKWDI